MADERFEIEKVTAPIDITPRDVTGLRPRYPNLSDYGYSYGHEEERFNIREVMRTIRKRKWLILTIAFVVTTLVTIEMYRTPNTYQASTTIEVGKDSTAISRAGDVILQDDFDPYFMVNIKTKILLLTSRQVLENTAIDLKLDQNPKFIASGGKKSVWDALKMIGARFGIGKSGENKDSDEDPALARLEKLPVQTFSKSEDLGRYVSMLQGGMSVEPIRETKALRVSFAHTDPKVAAEVANGIADSFLKRNFEAKTEKFTNTSAFLEEATRKLKAQVEEAEQKLANYTRERGIFSTDNKEGTLTTSKLANLHDQVMRAQSDRLVKQSLYEEVKQGRVRELPEAFADMLYKTSPKLLDLQKQLGSLETEAREMSVKFGPENPRVQEVKERIAAINDQVSAGTKALEDKLKNDYERAVRDEQMLKGALGQVKGEAVQQNQDAIQFNILKQDVETAKQLYQGFLEKSNQADVQRAEQHNNLRIIERADTPTSPVAPKRQITILLGLLLSTAVGIGLAFFLEYLDNTIKTVEDVSRYAQLPSLSVIPAVAGTAPRRLSAKGKKVIAPASQAGAGSNTQLVALDARSSAAEAYRVLRTSVLLSAAGQPPKTILITSGQPGEGKTTTAINTAISLSQLGASVLIIDCDLRRPTTHKVLGVDHMQGLSTYLSRNVSLDEVIQKLPIANLSLLPCGPVPPNPAELIISDKMKEMLRSLADRYDHIIIDSPPLINVTDPVILSTMVDGVILVVHGGKSTRDIVRRSRQELTSVGAKIFGVVLNNVDLRREGYDYYYYNRYYSGYAKDSAEISSQ